MKSNLELALVACSYREITSKIFAKVYGFTIIIVDINKKQLSSFFEANEKCCWNKKTFDELFDENTKTVKDYCIKIQYYERYNGPHGHGNCPNNISDFVLFDNYYREFII